MKKRLLALSLAALLSVPAISPVAAEDADFQKSYTVLLNDGFVNFKGQKPYNEDGHVFVPVRGIFEAMGFEVDYDMVTKTAYLKDELHSIEITLGNTYFKADDRTVYPEVPQFILNDSFMIPLRAVSEAIDAKVTYNEKSYVITIDYSTGRDKFGVKENSPAEKLDLEARASSTTSETTTEATTQAPSTGDKNQDLRTPFTINGETFKFGQTNLPGPTKKAESPFGFTWYIYNKVESEYYMLGVDNTNGVVAFYALTDDFSFEGYNEGMTKLPSDDVEGFTVRPYIRNSSKKNLNGKLYSIFVCKNEYMNNLNINNKVLDDMEYQLARMINTIRVREGNGLDPLEISDKYPTAKAQAESAANNHGTAETTYDQKLVDVGYDVTLTERYLFEDVLNSPFYFDILDDCLSDSGVYNSIMYGGFYFIDLGISYNMTENILCYAQNIFITSDEYYSDDYNY